MKKTKTFYFFSLCSVHRIWFDQAAIPRTMNKMERNAMVTLAWMKVTHVWSFDELHIIVQPFNVRIAAVSFSLRIGFSVFSFPWSILRAHTCVCSCLLVIFTKWWLILNWNMLMAILDSFHTLMKWIPSEDYTNPSNRHRWHSHMRHIAIGKIVKR